MRTILSYIRRFGFKRGLEFYRVARKCEADLHLLAAWANHFRARASREFKHDNDVDGRAFLAFAEILQTTHTQLVLHRKPRRPILSQNQARIDRAIRRQKARRKHLL